MSETYLLFGERLKQLRLEKKMTLDEMGSLLGTSKQVLSRYENSQRYPKITTAKLYAERLHVDLPYLMGETDKRHTGPEDKRPEREVSVVSSNGDKKIYNISPEVAEWMCYLLDHPDKLDKALDEAARGHPIRSE